MKTPTCMEGRRRGWDGDSSRSERYLDQEELRGINKQQEREQQKIYFIETHYEAGDRYWRGRHFAEAVRYFTEVLEADSKHTRARELRGRAYLAIGENGLAVKDLQRVIDFNPDSVSALVNCGVAYRRLDQHNEALKCFKRAIELDDKNADAFAYRGETYMARRGEEGDIDKALPDFNQAIRLKNNHGFALTYRGQLYLDRGQEGDAGKAWSDFNRALDDRKLKKNLYGSSGSREESPSNSVNTMRH